MNETNTEEGVVVAPEETVAEAPVEEAPVVEETVAPAEEAPIEETIVKFYQGKVVLTEGTRELEGKVYHSIRLEDGSVYDLTNEQYAIEVITKE